MTRSRDVSNYGGTGITYKNKIINGEFNIWQRGVGPFTSSNSYTADRWVIVAASGQTVSLTQQSFTAGNSISNYEPTYYSRIAWSGTPSGTYWYTQRVEDVRTFAGQTVTLSFWAKASSASTALIPAIEQNFGSGGSPVVTTTGIPLSLTTSWQRFSQTFTLPSISGKTIGTSSYLDVRPFIGSTSVAGINFDIWGVQLEKSSIATPLEQRPQQVELALCQRYYNRLNGNGATSLIGMGYAFSTTGVNAPITAVSSLRTTASSIDVSGFSVARIAAAGTPYNTGTTVLTSSLQAIGVPTVTYTHGTAVFTAGDGIILSLSASGYLGFSAEL